MTMIQFVYRVVFAPISLRCLYTWLLPAPRIRRVPFPDGWREIGITLSKHATPWNLIDWQE